MDEEKKISETTERAPKKRGGRKPMSAEEKEAAAKARADINCLLYTSPSPRD